jgi:two-component system chemotaxis response regulator CheY
MIVDDALYMRTLLKKVLGGGPYELVEAANGREAVERFPQEQPDLVLMDITMPEMDGISACRAICAAHATARIIICSALGQQQMVIEALGAGAKDFITKPFQPDQVLAAVARHLEENDSEEVRRAA